LRALGTSLNDVMPQPRRRHHRGWIALDSKTRAAFSEAVFWELRPNLVSPRVVLNDGAFPVHDDTGADETTDTTDAPVEMRGDGAVDGHGPLR
jgi:hypothetical protein